MQKEKLIILLTVFIDVLGIGIIIPILPYYVQSFGANAVTITILFATFSLFSFISSPFLGALSDRIGRRPTLIISIFSTAIGWIIFSLASSLPMLFLGRIIDGVAAGNFPIAQSYLADLSKDQKERTKNMGTIGGIFGIGFIIGPSIGAALSAISPRTPFWFVGILALINAISALLFLPESNGNLDKHKKIELNPLKPIFRALRDSKLKPYYIVWFLFGLAMATQQSIFSLYLKDVFGFTVAIAGTVFTIMGILMSINQVFALRFFWLKYFKEEILAVWGLLFLAIGFLLMSVPFKVVFFSGLFFAVLLQSLMHVVFASNVAGLAGDKRRGEVLGVMSSVISLSMVIAPIAAGFLFIANKSLPYIAGAFCLFIAFGIMRKKGVFI